MPATSGASRRGRGRRSRPDTRGYETDEYAEDDAQDADGAEDIGDGGGDTDGGDGTDDTGSDDDYGDADSDDDADIDAAADTDGGADGDDDLDGGDGADGGEVRRASGGVSATDAAEAGVRHVELLTGRQAVGVTGLERTADGWVVEVEIVEDRRVPSSSDILGLYRAELDTEGSVVGYRRTRRYPRGRGDSMREG